MKYNRLTRRMFLQGTGSTLLSIPFLDSLVPRQARAATVEPIRRYVGLSSAYYLGHSRYWFPKLTTLSNPLDLPGSPHKGSYDRLSTLLGSKPQLSRIINAS